MTSKSVASATRVRKRKASKGLRHLVEDESLVASILKLAKKRLPQKTIADLTGIGERTLHRWRELAEQGVADAASRLAEGQDLATMTADELLEVVEESKRPYVRFWQRFACARAVARQELLDQIEEHGTGEEGDWRALAWLGERLWPRELGRLNRSEVSGPEGGPIKGGVVILPALELEEAEGETEGAD
jgi:hypothetical protein